MKRAVFLDRDGTLIEEIEFLSDPAQVRVLEGVPQALKLFREMGFLIIVISNQSGVGRGYFDLKAVEMVNEKIRELLRREGTDVDDILFCPHAPEEDCMCRKPRPGLLLEAALRYGIDLKRSYMIGDRDSDVGAIASVGGKGILVLTGYGEETWRKWRWGHRPNFVARDLLEGAYWILAKEIKEGLRMLDEKIIEVMVCPICKGKVFLKEKGLFCEVCKLLYPIEEGIPIMIPEEAIRMEEEDERKAR